MLLPRTLAVQQPEFTAEVFREEGFAARTRFDIAFGSCYNKKIHVGLPMYTRRKQKELLMGGSRMKRLFCCLFVIFCLAALTACVSAADSKVETMKIALTVDENGTARADTNLHLVFPMRQNSVTLVLGPDVSGVHLDGYDAKISRAASQTSATISTEYGLPDEMDIHLTYTIHNTVQPGSDAQQFRVRLLGGIPDADIQRLTVSVKLPKPFSAIPEFSSGYYAESIDNYLNTLVSEDGTLTAVSTEDMLAGETLDLYLEMEPDYFTLHNVAGRTLLVDKIAMIVLALLGVLYWWRSLRAPLPRSEAKSRPPMGVEPGVAGMLMVGDAPDLALMVLHWAASGYLRISRLRGGQVVFSQRIPMGNERSAYEQTVFSRLFSHVSEVTAGSNTWLAAGKRADKAARVYWRNRIYERRPGNPRLLRTIAVLMCGFAALSCGDQVVPSMSLRALPLAAITLAGVIWGILLQFGAYRLPMRRKKMPIILLALCLVLMIVAWRLTGDHGTLLAAAAYSLLAALALVFGPKRKGDGIEILSNLLGWRRYLRTLSPAAAQQLLQSDPQYFYRNLLYAEALGVGGAFTRAFENCRLDECAFFEQTEEPTPRNARKFRDCLREVLGAARGEKPQKPAPRKPAPPAPPTDAYDHDRTRDNNPRRKPVEIYEPEEY